MPQFPIRTDTFANDARTKFPGQFYGKSDDEILQFFADKYPDKYNKFK